MAESLNVYQKWLGIPLHQQPPHLYRLLGIELFESDGDVIAHAADRQMAHVRTLSTGEHAAQAQQLLNEISAARVKLLNPQKKAAYDAALKADLAPRQDPVPTLSPAQPPVASFPTTAGWSAENVEEESELAPLWKNPLILATGAICVVMVVGICTMLYVKARNSQIGMRNSDEYMQSPFDQDGGSPGELAAVPVEEDETQWIPGQKTAEELAKETPLSSTPSITEIKPDNSQQQPEPLASAATGGESSSKKESESPDTTKEVASTKIDATKTDPTETDSTGTGPSQPDPSKTAAADGSPGETGSTKENPDANLVASAAGAKPSMEFTPDDPGPPEPEAGEPASPFKKREKLPVPESAAAANALAEVKEIFAKEYAGAKSYAEHRELARFLIRQAQDVDDDPTSQYVLYLECRAQAEAGGDFDLTMRAIDTLEDHFLVDALDLKIESLAVFSRNAKNDGGRRIVATQAIAFADQASLQRKFDTAEKLTTQAQSLAQRIGDNDLRTKARLLGNEIKKRRTTWGAVQTALEKLAAKPDDAEAHLICGKYFCLVEKDWETGLPHLAESNHPALSSAAKQDLAEPTEVADQVALGDAWYDLATSNTDWSNFRIREHYWYLKALPDTSGLARTKVEKRLRENPLIRFKNEWMFLPPKGTFSPD